MKPTKMTFQRLEKKYLLPKEQCVQFCESAKEYLEMDPYGPSTICNIYFDTEDDRLISTSLQKPPYKEKLRLRSYGVAKEDSLVYLEIKKKCRGVVSKRRIALSLEEARANINEGIAIAHHSQILSEIEYFMHFYHPFPKVFLAYDRIPYIGKEQDGLRITFDERIRRRYDHLDLGYGDDGELLLKEGMTLMEIKVTNAYPLWLTHMLSDMQIYPISFSKYGSVFTKDTLQQEADKKKRSAYRQTDSLSLAEGISSQKGAVLCSPVF